MVYSDVLESEEVGKNLEGRWKTRVRSYSKTFDHRFIKSQDDFEHHVLEKR